MTLPTPDTVSTADLTLADGRTVAVDAVLVAAGCRAHAKHLAGTIDASTAHPDRLHAVAADVEHLVVTAQRLTERSAHHDGPLERRVEHLRNVAEALNRADTWAVRAEYPRGVLPANQTIRYVARIGDGGPDLTDSIGEALLVDRSAARTVAELLTLAAAGEGGPRYVEHLRRTTRP